MLGVIGQILHVEWLRANQPVLINLGTEDEFGQEFREAEILGGKQVPLNFHLAQPCWSSALDTNKKWMNG